MKTVSRNVKILGLTSMLTDISSEMIFSVLPLFLANILHANMAVIGLIEGIAESTASTLKLFSGWISDRFGRRKPIVIFGYGLSTITKPLLAFAGGWHEVLFVRFVDRVGKGVRDAPRDALIAESSETKTRGRAFGYHRMLDTIGAVIGPLVAVGVLSLYASAEQGYRTIFLISIIPAFLGVLALFLVKEKRGRRNHASLRISFANLNKKTKMFLAVSFVFALGNFSYAFLILRAQDIGVSVVAIPLLYILFNVVYAASAFPIGSFADKVSKRKMIGVGYFLFALMCAGFIFASSPVHAVLLFALYGVFNSINETVARAYVSNVAQEERRGTALGAFHAATGLAQLPASVLMGALWQSFGAPVAFAYGGVCALAACALLFISSR